MARIQLDQVSVDLPVYSAGSRSLKARLLPSSRVAPGPRHQILVHALREITCEFNAGDHVALVGRNGAGKSTLLSVLAGIYEPAYGRVRIEGRIAALLDMSLGMEEDATGEENVTMRGRLLGMSPDEIGERMQEIIDFAALGDHIHLPLRTYSSGMRLRLAFAVSTCVAPDVLLLDEVIGVGDAQFAKKAAERMQQLIQRTKILVVASHNTQLLAELCNKAIWLEGGRVREMGPAPAIMAAYQQS
ncbi:ABC transporter ATP-binding protein [Hypericibacter sp.]|uniref:ABC transporter ATP-binding protein n=1 Tax=Hypericibacter sp. TaxID=2705401 RepID=UPI003D6D9F52